MLDKMLNSASPKRVIHKFPVYQGKIKLGLPAKFLHAAWKDDAPYFWVQHCPESVSQIDTTIHVYSTGDTVEEGFEFLGTYIVESLVWHIYAKAEKK